MQDSPPFLSTRTLVHGQPQRLSVPLFSISSSVVQGTGAVSQQKQEAKAYEKTLRGTKKKLGIALVGLGRYSTDNSRLH